ncbi:MAG: TRAP transporter large permease [Rhodospirillaceae bacterium]|nr:TRAP transporter large permease [Rhodospirillaceae bacterium]MYB11982.1 TRAP transporter large permease [Rhodospirillaceae bacterium]MYI49068.1 TRAP transporter large permease [Rhodospirillaceae bacterium]
MDTTLVGFLALFAICFSGVPLGYTLIIVGTIGFAYVRGEADDVGFFEAIAEGAEPAMTMAGQQIIDMGLNDGLAVLPLFVLMGVFIHRAGLSDGLYAAGNMVFGRAPGGLAMATVGACAGFAAVSGSSLATAATMAKVAMPSMKRYGYADSLAAGSIAAGGTLGILIPPSVPMVIYGILTESDIGKLFIAGVIPGILLTVLYIISIVAVIRVKPSLAPRSEVERPDNVTELFVSVGGVIVLFAIILGGIYLGVFTPSEAAGIGAAAGLLFLLMALYSRREFSWRAIVEPLIEAGITTSMIFVVAFGALIFANFTNLAGMVDGIVSAIEYFELSPVGVVLAMCVIYLLLGCVFDSLAMLLLTIPIFVAVIEPMGVDLIWFGIVAIIIVEIGLITPPIGMNVFVVKTVLTDVRIWAIFAGVWPFVVASLIGLALIIAVPEIALMLPNLMS